MRKLWTSEGGKLFRKQLFMETSRNAFLILVSLSSLPTLSLCYHCRIFSGHYLGHHATSGFQNRSLCLRFFLLFNSIPNSSLDLKYRRGNVREKIEFLAPKLSLLPTAFPADPSEKIYWALKPSSPRT